MNLQRIIYDAASLSPNDTGGLPVEKREPPAARRQASRLKESLLATSMLYLTLSLQKEAPVFLKGNGRDESRRGFHVETPAALVTLERDVTTVITDGDRKFHLRLRVRPEIAMITASQGKTDRFCGLNLMQN